MKIKIGDRIYNSEDQPIMIILTKKDKNNIKHMSPDATKYCCYPPGSDVDEILNWMKTE
jgi:hypothetical protein